MGDQITLTFKDVHKRIVRLNLLYECIHIFQSCLHIQYMKLKYKRKTGLRIRWTVCANMLFDPEFEGLSYSTTIKTISSQQEEERSFLMRSHPPIQWTSIDYKIDDISEEDMKKYTLLYGSNPPIDYILLGECATILQFEYR